MNVEFVNPCVRVALNVLDTMAQVKARAGRPTRKKGNHSIGDVTGIIGLAGEGLRGSFAVSFSEVCVKQVVSNMIGEKIDALGRDVIDAVGEITNMISGGVKAELSKNGYSFEMTIPSVVSGRGHKVDHFTDAPAIVIPFETGAGPFFIEACLKTQGGGG